MVVTYVTDWTHETKNIDTPTPPRPVNTPAAGNVIIPSSGIIATRERFLEWMASNEGKEAQGEAAKVPEETGLAKDVDFTKGKVIIMPVAIPGVGESSHSPSVAHIAASS